MNTEEQKVKKRINLAVPMAFAVLSVLLLAPVVEAQPTGVLFVKNNRVGIGISTPQKSLHVRESGAEAERDPMLLENNGNTSFRVNDTSADGSTWQFKVAGPSFRVNKGGTGGEELVVRNRNDGSGTATLTVNGSVKATNVTFSSSRAFKTALTSVDPSSVLQKVVGLPIAEWSFKNEVNGRRHLGPIAEDFSAAFGLSGTTDEISLIDASGVALAAVQGLYQLVEEKNEQIRVLHSRNLELEARLQALERKLDASAF